MSNNKIHVDVLKVLKQVRAAIKKLEQLQPATWHPLCPYPVYPLKRKTGTKKQTRRKKK